MLSFEGRLLCLNAFIELFFLLLKFVVQLGRFTASSSAQSHQILRRSQKNLIRHSALGLGRLAISIFSNQLFIFALCNIFGKLFPH